MQDIQVIDHIKQILNERNWTYYKLAKQSHIPHSSLHAILSKEHIPTLNTLIKICDGLDMSMSAFFQGIENHASSRNDFVELYQNLNDHSKHLVYIYMQGLLCRQIDDYMY